MVKRVARLFKPYRGQVGLVFASILVTGALGVAPAFITKAIINRALLPHDLHLLWRLVALMIAIPLVPGAMLLLSWQLTALSFAVVPVFVYLTWRVGRARRQLSKETQESLAELSTLTEETLSVSGVLLAKTFDRQRDAIARYREGNRRLAWLQVRQQMVGRSFFALVQVFFSA